MFFFNFITILTPIIITTYFIKKICIKKSNKVYKKFDHKNSYKYNLLDFEIVKNNKIIDNIIYEKNIDKYVILNDSIIIDIVDFDYICINYKINNKKYKYITNNNNLKLNLYNNEEIIDYIYINKIHDCILKINNNLLNIQNDIIMFIGPNYNFYNDLYNKLNYINVIKYILMKRKIYFNEEEILNSEINFKDNFMNEFKFNSNTFNGILNWKPTL
jgi:hypothetical protein